MPWLHNYSAVGHSLSLTAMVAALPIFFLFWALAYKRMKGYFAASLTCPENPAPEESMQGCRHHLATRPLLLLLKHPTALPLHVPFETHGRSESLQSGFPLR